MNNFVFDSFPVGPLQCNCTILGNKKTKEGLVIDPGGDVPTILKKSNEMGIIIKRIIHTHAHFDHILAAGILQEYTRATIELHSDDLFLWNAVQQQCDSFGILEKVNLPKPNVFLKESDCLGCNGVVIHTPGHSPGSLCFWFAEQKLLIAGDTLFKGGIGRTDLWKSDPQKIQTSIKHKLFCLNDDTKVITGHGPETILGVEKERHLFY